jgi:hypothetical protein
MLFYLTALQILNLSIDVDYVINNSPCPAVMADYDDVDSYAEYIIEKIMGNDNYTSENDDDSDCAQNKSSEKYDPGTLCLEQFTKPQLFIRKGQNLSWTRGLDLANKTCKGYFDIISPPPKA